MNPADGHAYRILLVLCFILPGYSALNGQEDFYAGPRPVMHEAGDWTLSLSPNYVYHPDAYPRIAGGINCMVFLGKQVSLNANMAAGQGYFQLGSGIIGVPALLAGGLPWLFDAVDLETMLVWAAMLALAFENINFHIPLRDNLEVSPYFSLLRVKYIEEGYGGYGNSWNLNLVLGIRLNIFLSDRFFIAPYGEVTRDWGHGSGGQWGVNGGLHAGFYFSISEP